jgi:mono/diheme cytochrome c family protein
MKLLVALPVLVVLVAAVWARRRIGLLGTLLAWGIALYVFLTFGFEVPVPRSVVRLYMGIVALALLVFVSADRERLEEVRRPLLAFLTERRFAPYRGVVVVALPVAVAANVYVTLTAAPQAPGFGRTVHPAPPDQITVHDETFNLVTLDNPYRGLEATDPEAFRRHLANGRRVYYQNCFFCHGDLMDGDGPFAQGLNPIPTNFQDAGNIPQLQESFLFWRIAKGGPGLPAEGGPWDTAMPAWEKFLDEEEIWDVVLFLYDFTGYRPRARHEVAGGGHE